MDDGAQSAANVKKRMQVTIDARKSRVKTLKTESAAKEKAILEAGAKTDKLTQEVSDQKKVAMLYKEGAQLRRAKASSNGEAIALIKNATKSHAGAFEKVHNAGINLDRDVLRPREKLNTGEIMMTHVEELVPPKVMVDKGTQTCSKLLQYLMKAPKLPKPPTVPDEVPPNRWRFLMPDTYHNEAQHGRMVGSSCSISKRPPPGQLLLRSKYDR